MIAAAHQMLPAGSLRMDMTVDDSALLETKWSSLDSMTEKIGWLCAKTDKYDVSAKQLVSPSLVRAFESNLLVTLSLIVFRSTD